MHYAIADKKNNFSELIWLTLAISAIALWISSILRAETLAMLERCVIVN